MLSLLGVIKIVLTLCKHSLWEPMVLLMVMELFCLMSSLIRTIPTIPPKSTLLPLAMVKLGLIRTCMLVEKFVFHYLGPGEVVLPKTGIPKYLLYFKFFSQFKLSLWANKSTSMNQDLKTNKEQRRAKRKTKPIQILLDTVILSMQWSRIFEIHQRVSKLLFVDTFT